MRLESFAALRAVLDDPFCDRASALRGIGNTEAEWRDETRVWAEALARSRRLRQDFAAAYAGARARRLVVVDETAAIGSDTVQRSALPFQEDDARPRIEALSRMPPFPLAEPALDPTLALTEPPKERTLPFQAPTLALTVEDHAAMVAEVSLFPARAAEVYRRFGIGDGSACIAAERLVQARLASDEGARARWQTAFAQAALRLRSR